MTVGRRNSALLMAVLALSAVIVVTAFNPAPHAGGDNAGYLSLAHGLLTEGAYVDAYDPERAPHTKYPPVFPLVLATMMLVGARTWVTFKAVAAVATVAAVGLTFLWAERRVGPVPAFCVATLLAASSAVVYYSHWILSDPLFLALTLASLVALERAPHEEGPWLALGVVAAGLALFTRSAGLPLVLAIFGWLGLRRRWRALAVTASALGVPTIAWWLRGRGSDVASYAQEFWMVDPYQPGLGTVDLLGLLPRALDNIGAYVLSHGPGGIVGQGTPGLGLVGVGLTLAAIGGWIVRARARVGVAELFFPLYAGLILVWPQVWAGDRFALPLYPLVFVYTTVVLTELAGRMPGVVGRLVSVAAFVALLLPAAQSWSDRVREARECARVTRADGAFACYGPRVGGFVEAAEWAGRFLPEDGAVLTRKPRHFYVLSGVPSRTFPFDEDPEAHLTLADRLGASYVLLDQWDGLAGRYVGAAVRSEPGAFCFVRDFGQYGRVAAQLLGIVSPAARTPTTLEGAGGVQIAGCPESYTRASTLEAYPSPSASGRIPLLDGLDS
jgi:hypothetical protein